jgi:hypothetical protein
MIFACANWLGPEMKIHFEVHKNKRICSVLFFLAAFSFFMHAPNGLVQQ